MNMNCTELQKVRRSGSRQSLAALFYLLLAMVFLQAALAQTAPTLGTAQSFAVLGGSTVTNTGPTIITGNLDVSPGSAVTGFPPGTVVGGTIHAADAVAAQAEADNVLYLSNSGSASYRYFGPQLVVSAHLVSLCPTMLKAQVFCGYLYWWGFDNFVKRAKENRLVLHGALFWSVELDQGDAMHLRRPKHQPAAGKILCKMVRRSQTRFLKLRVAGFVGQRVQHPMQRANR